MRTLLTLLAVFLGSELRAQTPVEPQGPKNRKGPPDEAKQILNEIKDAYKAPFEVHDDILKALRKSYQQPTPEREVKIFKELRRLYLPTAGQEEAILAEVRRAIQAPSAEQEERVFQAIRRADPLPQGAVPPSVQAQQAGKLFRRLDANGDGHLSPDEMPDTLNLRWDLNRDGTIDPDEYWASYQARLRSLSEQVAAGQIDLGLKRGGPVPQLVPTPIETEDPRPIVHRAANLPPGLPAWFGQLDTDRDGQIGMYEWRGGRALREFFAMDRNGDGFITIDELLRFLAQQSPALPGPGPPGTGGSPERR